METSSQLRSVDWVVSQLEREKRLPAGGIDIIPIIETGKGVANVHDIASAGTRVKRLSFGAGDYTKDMAMRWTRHEGELAHARAEIAVASRAAGLEAPLDQSGSTSRKRMDALNQQNSFATWATRANCVYILIKWIQ